MKNLAELRRKRHMSQIALSLKLGVAQETISAYESGKAKPSYDILIRLCDILGVSADYLLDRTDVSLTVEDFCAKNLSPEELNLIDMFRRLPPSRRERALGVILGLIE